MRAMVYRRAGQLADIDDCDAAYEVFSHAGDSGALKVVLSA